MNGGMVNGKNTDMKKILYLALVLIAFGSCTKKNYIDTGLANGKHNCTMLDYMRQDHYNFDSTVLVIERAGLEDYFDGTKNGMEQITFFAPTSFSIMRFMYNNPMNPSAPLYERVEDIPVEICREYILKHLVPSKMMRTDFNYRDISKEEIVGYSNIESVEGSTLHVYIEKEIEFGMKDTGPDHIFLFSDTYGIIKIASGDIEFTNGVMHSMDYNYVFTEI